MIEYSQMGLSYAAILRKERVESTLKKTHEIMKRLEEKYLSNPCAETREEYCYAYEHYMFAVYKNTKEYRHYFIDSEELCVFLEHSVKNPNPAELCHFLPTNEVVNAHIAIHYPRKYNRRSTAVCVCNGLISVEKKKMSTDKAMVLTSFDGGLFCGRLADYNTFKDIENISDIKLGVKRQIDIAIALAYYMKCFPGAIQDGFPENGKHPAHYHGNRNITIGSVPEICDRGTGCNKSPHFRNGYFKCLSSDFYTRMRGQVIFIRDTFVNGKAKTATLDEVPRGDIYDQAV